MVFTRSTALCTFLVHLFPFLLFLFFLGNSQIYGMCGLSSTRYTPPGSGVEPGSAAFSPASSPIELLAIGYEGNNTLVVTPINHDGTPGTGAAYTLPASFATTPKFSPDGLYLAAINNQNAVFMIPVNLDGTLGTPVSYPLPAGSLGSGSLVFSKDGKYLFVANGISNDVAVYQVSSGGVLSSGTRYPLPSGASPSSIDTSPDGQLVVTGNLSASLTIFQVGSGGALNGGTLYTEGAPVTSAVFSPDGQYVVATGPGINEIIVYTIGSGGTLNTPGTPYSLPPGSGSVQPGYLAFSENGAFLVVGNSGSGNISNITVFPVGPGCNLSYGTTYQQPPGAVGVGIVAISPSGLIATPNVTSGDVSLFTCSSFVSSASTSYPLPPGSRQPDAIVFSPDGTAFFTANYNSSDVTAFIFNKLFQPISYQLPAGSLYPSGIAISTNGLLATSNSGSNTVTLFQLAQNQLTGAKSTPLPGGCSKPTALAFAPDNSYLAVAADSGCVVIFDIADNALATSASYQLPAESSNPVSIAISPDGLFLATANLNNSIAFFTVLNGKLTSRVTQPMPNNAAGPESVAFLGVNGGLLVVVANSYTDNLMTFAVNSGSLVSPADYSLPLGAGNPQALAISSNNAYVGTADELSDTITVFPVNGGTLGQGLSYSLPFNSTGCAGLAFSPIISSNGQMVVATANAISNDVSVVPLLGSSKSSSGSTDYTGLIVGVSIGIPALFLTVAAAITGGFVIYRLWRQWRAPQRAINFDGQERSVTTV